MYAVPPTFVSGSTPLGLGVKIGGTDGREGCDGNYEVDPVHMAWNGCIILIGNPSEAG